MRKSYLPKALEIYRDHGGAKGRLRTYDGRVCMLGALREATGCDFLFYFEPDHPANYDYLLLKSACAELFPDRGTKHHPFSPVRMNDHPDTTPSDVEQVFEKAIMRWQEEI